jgi:hypothetical protein
MGRMISERAEVEHGGVKRAAEVDLSTGVNVRNLVRWNSLGEQG